MNTSMARANRLTVEDGVHVLRPLGMPVEVKRWREGDQTVSTYPGFTARLQRVDAVGAPLKYLI